MNVQAMSGNSMMPKRVRVGEGASSEHIPKPQTHGSRALVILLLAGLL